MDGRREGGREREGGKKYMVVVPHPVGSGCLANSVNLYQQPGSSNLFG